MQLCYLQILKQFKHILSTYTWVDEQTIRGLFSGISGKSFWGCSGLVGSACKIFWQEIWGKIHGESPSEVVNETISSTFK